jgi:predicted RNase H-like nuclease
VIQTPPPAEPSASAIVGIDLAWGSRARTGIAVLGASGELCVLESVRSDEEIDAVISPFLSGPCVVGIDAPLLVVNPTGRRSCEAALTRAFGRQHAGAYPSNTGLPHFADGGRAAALARRHRLDIDGTAPAAPGQRRALEVYPHSAAVALFDLEQVLKYKARRGRTLSSRRDALDRLVVLLSGLDGSAQRTALPRLRARERLAVLRREIAATTTGAALRLLEDPIDAILCAYVGALFLAGRTCVIGDSETGAIVTPVQERHRALLGLPACSAHAVDPARAGSQICSAQTGSR